eukprot:1162730-Rhodomonas_salina.2
MAQKSVIYFIIVLRLRLQVLFVCADTSDRRVSSRALGQTQSKQAVQRDTPMPGHRVACKARRRCAKLPQDSAIVLVVVVATAQAVTVLQRPGYPGMEATTMSTRIPAIMSDLTRPKQELLLTTPSVHRKDTDFWSDLIVNILVPCIRSSN